ncbi:N-acetyltransferase [Halorussus sp. MSC15.2]|uniref:GNAT family N-acetyltransferase n=1 Tax=Halorussus sp. MSC15.2 TaxID=2283638 RepID=UPI0013D43A61|nr:GNAT family N-acetyltransferase [Halorussus sp. MSC15.2]NEU56464.1 GNAT family N-acetyltransferase [Halorussus sp. MSC15.2]
MVSVELGSTADADAVADRWVELAAEQREFDSHLSADANRSAIREAIAQSAVADELLVARTDGGDIVGFVTFGTESSNYEQDVTRGVVQNIFVVPERRGEGIGSELLRAAERRLAESGADALALEVMAANDDARRFYRRHGYAPHRVELEKSVESDTLTKE